MLRLADATDAAAGRKAQTLARLRAAGLPVLDGVVLTAGATVDAAAITRVLGPGPYAVRSSSALEDRAQASAAGLYLSLTRVPANALVRAIAAVRASAVDEGVAAYLSAKGARPRPIAVLVQPYVGDVPLGVARSGADEILIEERAAGAPEWSDAVASSPRRGSGDPRAALVEAVERVLGGAIDIEYALIERGLVLLQARPSPAPRVRAPKSYPPGRWHLDAEHNPDPLSAAQAGLVALVDGPRFGARARVIDGYLYVREDQPRPRDAVGLDPARFAAEVEPRLRARIDAAGDDWRSVRAAYVAVVRGYAAEVRPSLGGARRRLDAILGAALGEGLADHPALVAGTGGSSVARDAALYRLGTTPGALPSYLARWGAYADAWDVVARCDDEDLPRLLALAARRARGPAPDALHRDAGARAAACASELRARLRPRNQARFDAALTALRAAVELAESDDRVFFEAQRLVRRALLRRGQALTDARRVDAREDVFELHPDVAMSDAADLRARVRGARTAREQAARCVAPARIIDGRPIYAEAAVGVLRGRGLGGRARGAAVVRRTLVGVSYADLPDGAVLVVPAALPSLAPHLGRLAALVTAHGGELSHAATLAREQGLPAVVGCAGALEIPDGAQLVVDGERGRVLVLA